jgi:hypothetical protein
MSFEITKHFVEQYSANVQHLVQQQGSRLRGAVRVEVQRGKTAFYDQIGQQTAAIRTTRGADTILNDTPHARRSVTIQDYEVADLIDDQDKLRMIHDPTSTYAQSQAMAMMRAMDDVIISAATGTAYTGVSGSTATTLPSSSKIAKNYVESGSATNSGLTIGKLRRAKYLLDSQDVDPSIPRFIVVHPQQIQDLLQEEKITSNDYAVVKALVAGEIGGFMGFNFITSNRLAKDGSDRTCFAYAMDGILLSMAKDVSVRIDPRPDKSYATQVYACMSLGATRMEEEKVVEILCVES